MTQSHTVGRWIFRRTVTQTVEQPVTTVVEGWPLWQQVTSITVYRLSRGFPEGGWEEQRQIWLAPNGDLKALEAKVARWEAGRSYPDVAGRVDDATDTDILMADQPWHDRPHPPRIPRGARDGRWDSATNLKRQAKPLPPGMRISQALMPRLWIGSPQRRDRRKSIVDHSRWTALPLIRPRVSSTGVLVAATASRSYDV